MKKIKHKSLFDGVKSQCIDSNGKCRIVNYKDISISTVLPILNVKPVPVDFSIEDGVKLATIDIVKKFAKSRNLTIVAQQGDDVSRVIMGVWAKSNEFPSLMTLYIPVIFEKDVANALPNINFNEEFVTDPIFTGETSTLDNMRHNAKVAEYLKQYSIYEWAQNPEQFDKNNFIIIKNHIYEPITDHFFSHNNVFFKKTTDKIVKNESKDISKKSTTKKNHSPFKIIVPDDETRDRLLTFVKVSALNDSSLSERYKNKKLMDGHFIYKNISDFRPAHNQLVFISQDAVLQWKREKEEINNRFTIHTHPDPSFKTAYYYRNYFIENGKLAIIQNTVFADFPAALAVSTVWERYGINVGYKPTPGTIDVPNNPMYKIYTNRGLAGENQEFLRDTNEKDALVLNVFNYDNGNFAALLFL